LVKDSTMGIAGITMVEGTKIGMMREEGPESMEDENLNNGNGGRNGQNNNNWGHDFNNQNYQNPPQFNQRDRNMNNHGRDNRRDPPRPRGVDSHFRPTIAENPSHIAPPNRAGRVFEIRPNYLTILPKFSGKGTEEPYLHLSEFAAICGTIGGHYCTQYEVKLRLFQFTLVDRAKQWFLTLPDSSIHTWRKMQQDFLDEYYPMSKTSDARDSIRSFQQLVGERLHDTWARFNDIIRMCPPHGIGR